MPEQNQPVNTLPIKTASGITAADYILGIGSTEEYQMLIQDLGDYIIQHATSSLAGQSQTLASVISAINSKNFTRFNNTSLLTSQIDVLAAGSSYCGVISSNGHQSETGVPVNSAGYVEAYIDSTGYKRLFFYPMNSNDTYTKDKHGDNAWGDWVQEPTRAEITALNSKPTVNATKMESVSFNSIVAYGSYACLNCTDTPNDSIAWYNLEVIPHGGANSGNAKYPTQIATEFHSYNQFIRYCNNGTWSSWQKLPTRTEVNAINPDRGVTTDANTATLEGTYKTSLDPATTNVPEPGEFVLEVHTSSFFVYQFLHTPSCTYFRRKNAAGWNNWVKQPTRAEITDINGKIAPEQITNIDLNSLTTPNKTYYAAGSNTCANVPNGLSGNGFGLEVIKISLHNIQQLYHTFNTNEIYVRRYEAGTWTSWEKQPTRAELGVFQTEKIGKVSTGTPVSVTYNNGGQYLLIGTHPYKPAYVAVLTTYLAGSALITVINASPTVTVTSSSTQTKTTYTITMSESSMNFSVLKIAEYSDW